MDLESDINKIINNNDEMIKKIYIIYNNYNDEMQSNDMEFNDLINLFHDFIELNTENLNNLKNKFTLIK